jgi:hypothetical protein
VWTLNPKYVSSLFAVSVGPKAFRGPQKPDRVTVGSNLIFDDMMVASSNSKPYRGIVIGLESYSAKDNAIDLNKDSSKALELNKDSSSCSENQLTPSFTFFCFVRQEKEGVESIS